METNFNSGFHHLLSHHQLSYVNSLSSPFNLGQQNNIPPYMNPFGNIASPNGTLTEISLSGVPYPVQCQPNGTHGLLYGPPHYHQAFKDVANPISHDRAPYLLNKKHEEINTAYPGSRPNQKRFIVFDQSGDQTTLFYSPGIGLPVPSNYEVPKTKNGYVLNKMFNTYASQHQEPILTYAYIGRQNDTESEMREDTEELNALLYSDNDYYEDEEEASTGHSPSTMTYSDGEKGEDGEEEVASNFGPKKRIKLSTKGFDVSTLVAKAGSSTPTLFCELEDGLESICGDGENLDFGGFGMSSGRKRSKTDQLRETVRLLQSIIPGGKGKEKDVIRIFDEAIDYLKSLKVKAQTLGVHTM